MSPTAAPMVPPRESDAPLPASHAPGSGGVEVYRGVPFADLPGCRPLELDLWRPAGRDDVPLVVFWHGGGWRAGSRHSLGPMYDGDEAFRRVAGSGLAVASVDYRLSGEARWPAQREDVHSALGWLRRRGNELGVDSTRLGVWGESAGAHLAAFAALDDDAVDVAVLWYCPADLLSGSEESRGDPTSREGLLLGSAVDEAPDRARLASPSRHVTTSGADWLLLHGADDDWVLEASARPLHDALVRAGASSRWHTYPEVGHLWLGRPDIAADALDRTISHLHSRLS
jgi:acetyl esterase/lipase